MSVFNRRPAEVVGSDEVGEMPAETVAGVVAEALDGHLLKRPVHAFDDATPPTLARCFGQGRAKIIRDPTPCLRACKMERLQRRVRLPVDRRGIGTLLAG